MSNKPQNMKRESITIKKTLKNVWMKKYDDYEKSFKRISKKEAFDCINNARERGDMFSDGNENSTSYEVFGYWN